MLCLETDRTTSFSHDFKVDLGRVGQRHMEVSGFSVEWVFSFHFVWVLGVGLVHQAYTASALPPEPPHWPNFYGSQMVLILMIKQ